MQRKLRTFDVDWRHKTVLDVGTDHGFWCFHALEQGADYAIGLDRGRPVQGVQTDLVKHNTALAEKLGFENVAFAGADVGKQWGLHGSFDITLMFSCYHHVYNNCEQHLPIWYWLWQHMADLESALFWEGDLTGIDGVVRRDVRNLVDYKRDSILAAAHTYFKGEKISDSAISGREVWRFEPKHIERRVYEGRGVPGSGGATKAFEHAGGRRISEIRDALGVVPVPGSLNVHLAEPFDWGRHYFRTEISDVMRRRSGLDSPWALRWCRFYPVTLEVGTRRLKAFVMRFEGEAYPLDFVELISEWHIRDTVGLVHKLKLYQ